MKHLQRYILKNYPNVLEEFIKADRQISYCNDLADFADYKSGYIRTLAKKDMSIDEMKETDLMFADMDYSASIKAEYLIGLALDQIIKQNKEATK